MIAAQALERGVAPLVRHTHPGHPEPTGWCGSIAEEEIAQRLQLLVATREDGGERRRASRTRAQEEVHFVAEGTYTLTYRDWRWTMSVTVGPPARYALRFTELCYPDAEKRASVAVYDAHENLFDERTDAFTLPTDETVVAPGLHPFLPQEHVSTLRARVDDGEPRELIPGGVERSFALSLYSTAERVDGGGTRSPWMAAILEPATLKPYGAISADEMANPTDGVVPELHLGDNGNRERLDVLCASGFRLLVLVADRLLRDRDFRAVIARLREKSA